MDGVLVCDKPAGMTSHDVVARVRRLAGQRRVGHGGTLDPPATGVLVLALGRATRLLPFLPTEPKRYLAEVAFGAETDTLDATGTVTASADAAGVDQAALRAALAGFVGPQLQVPPMVSAIKVGGERLYAKARRGEQVDRAPRPIVISELELRDFTAGERAARAPGSWPRQCSTRRRRWPRCRPGPWTPRRRPPWPTAGPWSRPAGSARWPPSGPTAAWSPWSRTATAAPAPGWCWHEIP